SLQDVLETSFYCYKHKEQTPQITRTWEVSFEESELNFKVFKYTSVQGLGDAIKEVGNKSMVGESSQVALETTIEDLALQTPLKAPTTAAAVQDPAASPDESTASPMPTNDNEPCSVSEKEISSTEKTPAKRNKGSPAKKLKSRHNGQT
ncbi:hypothetical protein CCACVL1_02555, partial [Corchorus capsularis]